jgi:uncharacterized protein YbjT (DUF2867 family)
MPGTHPILVTGAGGGVGGVGRMVVEQLRAHGVPVRALVHHDDDPSPPTGRVYELTGAESRDMTAIAAELSAALGRPVTYVDVPYEEWLSDLEELHLPPHVFDHIATMARLHRQNRYDRVTTDIADLLGRSPSAFTSFVRDKAAA